jgi:hypothetical protein
MTDTLMVPLCPFMSMVPVLAANYLVAVRR